VVRWRAEVADWSAFLLAFHAGRPGITEATLGRASRPRHGNAYEWLVDALPADATTVVDVGCGSAPLQPLLRARRYVGADFSTEEFGLARERGRGPLVRATAEALPVATGSVDAVTISMALQVLDLDAVLRQCARVLRAGGILVATVPAGRVPRSLHDVHLVCRLALALRRVPSYRNDKALRHPSTVFAPHRLRVLSDESLDFPLRLDDEAAALAFVDSLYLAALDTRRRHRAAAALVGRCWPVRVRRLVVERH